MKKEKWTKGLSERASKDLVDEFKNSPLMRKQVREVLDNMIKSIRTERLNSANFNSPSWAYHQAETNGIEKAFIEFRNLFDD